VPRDLAHRGQHAFAEGRLAELLGDRPALAVLHTTSTISLPWSAGTLCCCRKRRRTVP
jgi:hypothetical protein